MLSTDYVNKNTGLNTAQTPDDNELPKRKRTPLRMFKQRLRKYGMRLFESFDRFMTVFWTTVINVGTALAGSILVLPVLVMIRGLSVLLANFVETFVSAVRSLMRIMLDGGHFILWHLQQPIEAFNTRLLYL
jgi:hypothetical protein